MLKESTLYVFSDIRKIMIFLTIKRNVCTACVNIRIKRWQFMSVEDVHYNKQGHVWFAHWTRREQMLIHNDEMYFHLNRMEGYVWQSGKPSKNQMGKKFGVLLRFGWFPVFFREICYCFKKIFRVWNTFCMIWDFISCDLWRQGWAY